MFTITNFGSRPSNSLSIFLQFLTWVVYADCSCPGAVQLYSQGGEYRGKRRDRNQLWIQAAGSSSVICSCNPTDMSHDWQIGLGNIIIIIIMQDLESRLALPGHSPQQPSAPWGPPTLPWLSLWLTPGSGSGATSGSPGRGESLSHLHYKHETQPVYLVLWQETCCVWNPTGVTVNGPARENRHWIERNSAITWAQ